MAKISFDIKYRPQIESGEYKVETRDGRPARIICWDKIDDDYPLVVLVCSYDDGVEEEFMQEYTLRGEYHARNKGEITTSSKFDLFLITPEPELTEFENAVLEVYEGLWEGPVAKEDAKQKAAQLLDIARKEIEKDLPRWKKHVPGLIPRDAEKHPCMIGADETASICKNGFYILISDLENLPNEE